MKQIPLRNRQGRVVAHALVDDEDYESIAQHRWYRTSYGYAARGVWTDGKCRMHLMHRVILDLEHGDERVADHVNRDRLDNRRANLRVVERAQNAQNQSAHRGSRSRHRGVCWHKQKRKWMAYSYESKRIRFLGYFDDEQKAADAASAFRREHMPLAVERG